jgi:hypothetical protein
VSITDRLEAFATGAALVRSVQERDDEGRRAIMADADHQAVAEVLARILAGVLRASAGGCDHCASEFVDAWQAELRQALADITEE